MPVIAPRALAPRAAPIAAATKTEYSRRGRRRDG